MYDYATGHMVLLSHNEKRAYFASGKPSGWISNPFSQFKSKQLDDIVNGKRKFRFEEFT